MTPVPLNTIRRQWRILLKRIAAEQNRSKAGQ